MESASNYTQTKDRNSRVAGQIEWSFKIYSDKLLIRMLAYSKPVLNFINGSKNEWRKLMSNERVKKNRHHKRNNYEIMYNRLRVECGELKTEPEMLTNLELLDEINYRLMKLNVAYWQAEEIYDILDKIN